MQFIAGKVRNSVLRVALKGGFLIVMGVFGVAFYRSASSTSVRHCSDYGCSSDSLPNLSLEKKPLLEMATIKQPLLVQFMATKGRWPIQSKLTLQGRYDLKIGFDLSMKTAITVDSFNLKTKIKMPRPQILSVEQTDFQVIQCDQAI